MSRHMAPVEEQLAVLMRGTDFGDEQTRTTMERELRALLEQDHPLRVYCGYDPTSVDLTLGHTLSMRKLRQFQDFGHDVTFLIGNFTGLVGDVSGHDRSRPMLTAEQLEANARDWTRQAFRVLDAERTTVRRNADWLATLTFADVIQLASKFTVAQFLERDNFRQRWEAHEPIHLHEFMYAIMQAFDAVELQTDVQVGGTEQLFNLLAGRVLQREYGQEPQVVVTVPILVGTDGTQRMSKSSGNYIAIDDPPNEMYGKVMSLPDSAIEDYFTLVTALPAAEVDAIVAGLGSGALAPMEGKKRLALEVTAAIYSADESAAAQAHFEATIQRGELPDEMQECTLPSDEHQAKLHRVLVAAGVASSNGEVRRLVAQGGISINGDPVTDFACTLHPNDEIKIGRHRFLRVVAGGGESAS